MPSPVNYQIAQINHLVITKKELNAFELTVSVSVLNVNKVKNNKVITIEKLHLGRKHCQVEVQENYFWTSFANYKKIS